VIGVAKSAFRTATHAIPVQRGISARTARFGQYECPNNRIRARSVEGQQLE
jgi:hypothetical protein